MKRKDLMRGKDLWLLIEDKFEFFAKETIENMFHEYINNYFFGQKYFDEAVSDEIKKDIEIIIKLKIEKLIMEASSILTETNRLLNKRMDSLEQDMLDLVRIFISKNEATDASIILLKHQKEGGIE